ncbi:MAG: heme-binding protein [Rhodoplanes sp.]|uniref:GlcG/HbpS family heme-binding protein n=1 Tax=Rhodoplanes sp. TaxID=1968906 RepID=UPI001837174D|nr:heme-binding protein [Rhodoplanes sp.]NVO12645.1 heme-binding protein [Rhodoplanes sp.]
MQSFVRRGAPVALASLMVAAIAGQASAQLLTEKSLSLAQALTMAQTAAETCKQQGYRVTVTVLGREGETRVVLRGDGASPHTVENSRRKAYTARTVRMSSADFAKRLADPATAPTATAQATLPGFIALAGALPVKVGEEVIGAIGVSGAPGGERDEVCARAGLDKIAAELK